MNAPVIVRLARFFATPRYGEQTIPMRKPLGGAAREFFTHPTAVYLRGAMSGT